MRSVSLIVAAYLAACTPPLDWREIRPPETGAEVLFPCKPSQNVRRISMAGTEVDMALLVCEAGGATWALSHADVVDPARVTQALDELAGAAMRNVAASSPASAPVAIAGMTPNPRASRMRAAGRRPDGAEVHTDTTVFARGTRVYQITVLARRSSTAPVDTFVASVRWP
jgi:hypothetical protein